MVAEYLVNLPIRLTRGMFGFFYIWYVQSSKSFWTKEISFLKQVERDIGIKINLRLIAEPIYGDYSYLGRVIGPLFRLVRVLVGLLIVGTSFVLIILAYIVWVILPPLTLWMFVSNLLFIL